MKILFEWGIPKHPSSLIDGPWKFLNGRKIVVSEQVDMLYETEEEMTKVFNYAKEHNDMIKNIRCRVFKITDDDEKEFLLKKEFLLEHGFEIEQGVL